MVRFSATPSATSTTSAANALHNILVMDPPIDLGSPSLANLRPPEKTPLCQIHGNIALRHRKPWNARCNEEPRRSYGTEAPAQRDDLIRTGLHSGPLLHGHEDGRRSLPPAP